mgnify:CR=1 FL=1
MDSQTTKLIPEIKELQNIEMNKMFGTEINHQGIVLKTSKTWKNSGSEMPTEKLPLEERWSARYFSLDKVLKPVIIEGDNVKKVDWFHSISNWENYRPTPLENLNKLRDKDANSDFSVL